MLRILIVEDSADRLEVLLSLTASHSVFATGSGGEAITNLEKECFDLVFLDYDLAENSTSEPIARFISNQSTVGTVIVHSENPAGVEKLKALLAETVVIPFSSIVTGGKAVNMLKQILASPEATDVDLQRWTATLK